MNLTLAKGKPPAWTPPVSPIKLREDNGSYFRDPNAARYPNHPIEPAVRAIFACQPDFRGYEIDLFACSRTLGDLLRFVRGVDKSFRILVEAVGNTVFFVRRENSPTELIPDVRGYGHSFPEAYTTWGSNVKKSEFEADGYPKDTAEEKSQVVQAATPFETDDLASQFAELSSNMCSTQGHSRNSTSLTAVHGGQQIPRAAIFDLKTRSFMKKDQDTLEEELPRLFDEIQVRNVTREIVDWERENQAIIRRFALLLRKIVSFVTSIEGERLELHRRGLGVLEIREQTKEVGQSLSPDVGVLWVLGPEDDD
ncbi:MAG: hypothetical protein LQ342_004798 [Letrouitia transgressa]|nr:MAG: hypothetical protein LQ342_004798 [Letrouitia transgressa]